MKINDNEVIMMNKIIIEAVSHGGDVAPYFSGDLEPILNMWLRMKGLDERYKVSHGEWNFIVPIEEKDVWRFQSHYGKDEEAHDKWYADRERESEWVKYFTDYKFHEEWETDKWVEDF